MPSWTSNRLAAMHTWPELRNLPQAIFFAASSRFAVRSTMTGDFPPSSSVTGVRCSAAAFMTTRPTAGLPVKKMWSHFFLSNASATAASPSMTATSRSSNSSPRMRFMHALVCGVSSEGLITTQLPAAIAETSGPSVRFTGKFHGEMMSTTPFASCTMRDREPNNASGVDTRRGRIQRRRWRMAWRASETTG